MSWTRHEVSLSKCYDFSSWFVPSLGFRAYGWSSPHASVEFESIGTTGCAQQMIIKRSIEVSCEFIEKIDWKLSGKWLSAVLSLNSKVPRNSFINFPRSMSLPKQQMRYFNLDHVFTNMLKIEVGSVSLAKFCNHLSKWTWTESKWLVS